MDAVERHALEPDASFDGGELDCGNGLLLLIRQHIDPLARGQLLEFRSTEISVEEDFPAWCRMTGNELVSLVRRGRGAELSRLQGPARRAGRARGARRRAASWPSAARSPSAFPPPCPPPPRRRRFRRSRSWASGSWPRPRWMLEAIHAHMEGRLSDAEFEATSEDATRLAVDGPAPRGRRRRHRRRAAARQLRELRRRPPRQLPAHPAHRPAAPGRRSRGVRGRAEIARRARLRGAPSRRVRAPRPEPAAGGSRARLRALAHRPAGEGRPARPVSPHAHHVDGVHLRPRVSLARGPGRGHRARAARGDPLSARGRREPRPARRARALRGRLHRREEQPELHVRGPEREGRCPDGARLRPGADRRGGGRPAVRHASPCTSAAATGRATSARRWRATTGRSCRSSRRSGSARSSSSSARHGRERSTS